MSAHGPDGLSIRDSNQAGPGSLKKVLPQDEQVVRFNMTLIGLGLLELDQWEVCRRPHDRGACTWSSMQGSDVAGFFQHILEGAGFSLKTFAVSSLGRFEMIAAQSLFFNLAKLVKVV